MICLRLKEHKLYKTPAEWLLTSFSISKHNVLFGVKIKKKSVQNVVQFSKV